MVEDAAHALPTTIEKELVGTLGSDATVYFSFYANKTMTTGEGGMLVTRNAWLASARVMRLHGMNRDAFDRFTAKVPSWYYEIVAPGYKYNLTDIAAALGLHQLKRLPAFQARREAIAQRYQTRRLPTCRHPAARAPGGYTHSWHLYVVRLADTAPHRSRCVHRGMFAAGIGCSDALRAPASAPYWRDRYGLSPTSSSTCKGFRDYGQPAALHGHERCRCGRVITRPCAALAGLTLSKRFARCGCWLGLLIAGAAGTAAGGRSGSKLDSPGPVLFRQERVQSLRQALFHPQVPNHARGAWRFVTIGQDPRITTSGALAASQQLDELPQLWDVLRGAMSLVGPRPRCVGVALYPPEAGARERSQYAGHLDPGVARLSSRGGLCWRRRRDP